MAVQRYQQISAAVVHITKSIAALGIIIKYCMLYYRFIWQATKAQQIELFNRLFHHRVSSSFVWIIISKNCAK